MDCKDVRSLIYTYIDGELSKEEALDIEHHLKTCKNCFGYFKYQEAFKKHIKSSIKVTSAPECLRLKIIGKKGFSKEQLKERKIAYRGFWVAAVSFIVLFSISPSFMGYTNLSDQNRNDFSNSMQVYSNNPNELLGWLNKNYGESIDKLNYNNDIFPMNSIGAFINNSEKRSGIFYHYKGEKILYKRLNKKPFIDNMNTYIIGNKRFYLKQDGPFYHIYWPNGQNYYALISRLSYNDVEKMIQSVARN